MKRNILYVALVLALLFPVAALAADFSSPAELLSSLTGISVQDLYEQRQQDKTYGQIADENDVLAEYQAGQLNLKKQIIEKRVQAGVITLEQGEAIKQAMENRVANCDGTMGENRERLGQQFGGGLGFGASNGLGNGLANGNGVGRGRGMGMGRGVCVE
jgi:TolA-binding protein